MICEVFVENILVTRITIDTRRTFWRNRAQFERSSVMRLLEMFHSVPVAATAIIVLTSAAEVATSHA